MGIIIRADWRKNRRAFHYKKLFTNTAFEDKHRADVNTQWFLSLYYGNF